METPKLHINDTIAAAREAVAEVERIKAEYKEEPLIKAFVLADLLAAFDAAQGEAAAWQVNAFGVCQKIVRREDVADELSDSYRRSDYENVEIVPLFAAPPAAVPAGYDALRRFANWAVDEAWQGRDISGGDVQDKARDLGLIDEVTVTEPCSDMCNCGDGGFPTTCYRLCPVLAAARKGE